MKSADRSLQHRIDFRKSGVALLVGEVDNQNAILSDDPDQHDDADLAKHIERLIHSMQRKQRTRERERHRGCGSG